MADISEPIGVLETLLVLSRWQPEHREAILDAAGEIERLRRELNRIKTFPYIGKKAAQQMALIAGAALQPKASSHDER